MQDTQDKPDVSERYASATHTSNLRVEMDAERHSDVDILVAASWSASRIGGALMRLHTEFDGSQHPRRMSKEAIRALAATLPVPKDCPAGRKSAFQLAEARKTADQWYRHEVGLLLSRLKTMPAVRQQLTIKAMDWRSNDPLDLATSLLVWWLDRVCPVCHGTKWQIVAGTGRHSGKACHVCNGSGEAPIPHEQDGRKMANFIDDCVLRWRSSTKQGLRKSGHHG